VLNVSTPQNLPATLTFAVIFSRDAIEALTIAQMADLNNIFNHGSMPAQI